MDTRPQAFPGQRRQQRHPEDESTNGFLPATSPENFLLAPNAQGAFTFSAEPSSMIDYASMPSLSHSSVTGHESVFTPNTGSSLDSSFHQPDLINQSYPPPNVYMQPQTYTLSPGLGRNGQSISPSHSVDHLSPEGGYMSDPNSYSNYTTPSFNGQYLDDQFATHNFVEHIPPPNNYDPFPNNLAMPLPITSDALATFAAQMPPLPSNARSDTHSQLLSPCLTNNSSPIVTDDMSVSRNISGVQYSGSEYQQSSTPPRPAAIPMQTTPSKQQHSPALTNSPGNVALANSQLRAHLTSPIVRIEHYSRGESPSPSDLSRALSKRSHGSHRHLSPFPNDESSEDEDPPHAQVRIVPLMNSRERGEDGSWLPVGASGQAGLSPDDREALKDVWVPSLEDISDRRLKEEKKLEVQDWLTKSEVGSEAGGDRSSSTNLLKPFNTRPRAKSTNDVHRQAFGETLSLGVRTNFHRFDDSGIPGPGAYVDEQSEYDDYEDEDDENENEEAESPPAEIDIVASHSDNPYFPPIVESNRSSTVVRPWVDLPVQSSTSSTWYQPPTSNAAMARFRTRAKDVESASLAATVGSRRLSESDIGSIKAAPGVIRAIEPDSKKQKERQRRPSFLENILPRRAPSNLLKRKGSIPVQSPQDTGLDKTKDLPGFEKPKRIGSWGRPKSPRLDTSVANHGNVGPPTSSNLTPTVEPWYHGAKTMIKRTRSRSDLGKSPGLAELMTHHGGPPMPMLASPLAETEATKPSLQPSHGGDDEEEVHEAVTMDLKVRYDPIIPTAEGFRTHARQLNPRLVDYMVDRITQEQTRRYKRLLEFKVKHLIAVKNHSCSSAKFCTELGGESKPLPPRAGNKDSDAPFIGFQITAPGSSDDDGESLAEGTVVSAQFPSGVPLPPVKRLPAEFECPLCFKVKKFYKPSDWTKHVHEDIQPFTCTFPNCGEPKSFKRKADWVRHENERHRQLENWTCQIADCNHTCYRKDNFVQHLVREHKIAEPRARTGRGGNKDAPPNPDTDDIWSLVERFRQDTTKQPKDEPCRFCGNICNSWKKLTVHLAKHMEQISMPILPLVEKKQMNADTIISPVMEMPESRKLSMTPNRSPIDNPSRYNPNAISTLAPGIDPSFGRFPQDLSPSGAASNAMHTYPPPQMMTYKSQQQGQQRSNGTSYVDSVPNYAGGSTYPGLQEPVKAHGTYFNGLQIPNQPYPNGGIHNGPSQFSKTPVSSMGQQPVYTSSPVDTTPYSTDTMGPAYFTHEPQNISAGTVVGMGFDAENAMHFQQSSAYNSMAYMGAQQHSYPFQSQ